MTLISGIFIMVINNRWYEKRELDVCRVWERLFKQIFVDMPVRNTIQTKISIMSIQ